MREFVTILSVKDTIKLLQ